VRTCPSDTAPEDGYSAYFCATQLVRDKHAGDMPAKNPTFSVLSGFSARTPRVGGDQRPFCDETAEIRVRPRMTTGAEKRIPYGCLYSKESSISQEIFEALYGLNR
jgi:hypothetical protein